MNSLCCFGVVFLLILALPACDSKSPAERHEPVVVYATDDGRNLEDWFSAFTDETGIPVTLRFGDSSGQTDAVIANTGTPPADLLIANNIADIWRAADEGALRPIQAPGFDALPDGLKDTDGLWAAIEVRLAVIVKAPQSTGTVLGYSDLADPAYLGQMCLSTSRGSVNRALIAMLIESIGNRPAELIVRGWVRNLALPPFDTEKDLLAAVDAETCTYGIVSDSLLSDAAALVVPIPAYINVTAIGVARHARYPASAQSLVEWMLEEALPSLPPGVFERNIGIAGWRDEEARQLAERAGYR